MSFVPNHSFQIIHVFLDYSVSILQLSAVSDISHNNIDFAKGKGTFPCEVSLLEMQSDLEWNPQVTSLNSWPLYISDDGAVIYYW